MSRLFVIALLALLAGVGFVALIETEPGYLLIAYGGYTIESSFWVGIVLIATALLLLYTGLRFVARLLGSPGRIMHWAGARRLRQAARLSTRGVINFTQGNWSRARRQLLRGARFGESPLLNYLLAARASYRLGEPEAMRRYLTQAAGSERAARIAVDLTQAELQLHARQYEQALATLKRAQKNRGKHPFVLHLLCQAYQGLGDLEAMAALLPELRKRRVAGAAELDELEARVYRDLLEKAAVKGDAANLQALWKTYPTRLQGEEAVQFHYLEALLACDEIAVLEKEIVKRLKKQWQPRLLGLYGRIPRQGAQKQMAVAEGWLKERAKDPDLLLCIARLAMAERQWGKAREYLERSQAARPSEEVCLELGRLLMAAGEHTAAAAAFHSGAALRREPLPELPRPDDIVPATHRLEEEN